MIRIVLLLILESILDNDCQAHDDDRHEDDNEISDSGHFNIPYLQRKINSHNRARAIPALKAVTTYSIIPVP
jgi:hypothetical protein